LTQLSYRLVREVVPVAWLAIFALLAMMGATLAPPSLAWFFGLAAAGFAYCLVFCRSELAGLLREHRLLLGALVALAIAIGASETIVRKLGLPLLPPLPPSQIGLVLCAAPLAIFLMDARRMRALALLFLAVCAWHLVAMPVEAVSGVKVTWHAVSFPMPRPAGPLNFQASGLAMHPYFFTGLFAPMLYLAAGPLFERKLLPHAALDRTAIAALSAAWLIPCLCVQSRSLLAGALAASVFYFVASGEKKNAWRWAVAAAVVCVAAAAYWYLFSANKTGPGLRWAYLELYSREAVRWPSIAIGHGLTFEADPAMLIPGLAPITHSHNDVVQMLYSWGLPALLAYAVFWFALLKLIYSRFAARKEYWPVCALLVVIPSMVTDAGFQHYEKAAFLVILAAFCMALAPRRESAVTP
jgi:hypothetical protein